MTFISPKEEIVVGYRLEDLVIFGSQNQIWSVDFW
jgi:hypothetical protein